MEKGAIELVASDDNIPLGPIIFMRELLAQTYKHLFFFFNIFRFFASFFYFHYISILLN